MAAWRIISQSPGITFYENNLEETSFKPWRAEENEYTVILRAALLYLGDIYYSSLGERCLECRTYKHSR